MANYLGIDYGQKRIGLSFADQIGVAIPLAAIRYTESNDCWVQLAEVIAKRQIQHIVIGYPLNMDGSVNKRVADVEAFTVELKERFQLPVTRVDERLTTVQVENDLAAFGLTPRKKRKTVRQHQRQRVSGDIDSRAATLILHDYLASQDLLDRE